MAIEKVEGSKAQIGRQGRWIEKTKTPKGRDEAL